MPIVVSVQENTAEVIVSETPAFGRPPPPPGQLPDLGAYVIEAQTAFYATEDLVNTYVPEGNYLSEGSDFYVAEDGVTFYVQ